jgi:hypothetical protein
MRWVLCNRDAEFDVLAAKVREEFFELQKAANRHHVSPMALSRREPHQRDLPRS